MKINKLLLTAVTQAVLFSSMATAGDVEIHLPAATDAMTVDQPAGTELMRVNGNGDVGIGTETPNARLDVKGRIEAVATDPDVSVLNSVHGLTINGHEQPNEAGDHQSLIGFADVNKISRFQMGYDTDNADDGSDLNDRELLIDYIDHSSDPVVYKRIASFKANGRTGFGYYSPKAIVHIDRDGGESVPVLHLSNGEDSFPEITYEPTEAFAIGTWDADNQLADVKLKIEVNTGNVGIGTTNPSKKLHVQGAILSQGADGEGNDIGRLYGGVDNNDYIEINSFGTDDFMSFWVNSEAMRISTGGNVGIGTTTPDSKLDVAGSIKVGDSAAACNSSQEGGIRYEATSKKHQGCDGTSWNDLY